jgi:molecular chaperone GrpE
MAIDRPENGDPDVADDTYVIEDTGESLSDFEPPATEEPSSPAAPRGAGTDSPSTDALRQENQKIRDQYLRSLADFENFRKRSEREKNDFHRYANLQMMKELLPVLDNLERAFSHVPDAEGEFAKGIDLIYKQLADGLQKNGLRAIGEAGVPFDPNIHEAVMREEDPSVPSHTVTEVLQKGYFLHDRLVRPAMVRVAVGGPDRQQPASSGII